MKSVLTEEDIIRLTPWYRYPYESFVEYELEDLIKFALSVEQSVLEKLK